MSGKDLPNSRIRILIADDQPLFRDGLRSLLGTEPDLELVGEASDAKSAVDKVGALLPDVLLLDVSMPGTSGIAMTRELARVAPLTRVLLLTAGIEPAELREALRHGARGVALKTSGSVLLLKAIRSVANGEHWISRDVVNDLARTVAGLEASAPSPASAGASLTARERAVTALLVEGMTNKAIAMKLNVSEDTVKHHLTSVFRKTGAPSRVELALYAVERGLAAPTRTTDEPSLVG